MTNQKETYLLQADRPGGHTHTAKLSLLGHGLSTVDLNHGHQIRFYVANEMIIPEPHTHVVVRAPPQI